jgi:hypothetical protein
MTWNSFLSKCPLYFFVFLPVSTGLILRGMARICHDEGSILDHSFFDLQSLDILLTMEFHPDQIRFLVLYVSFPKIPDRGLIRDLFGKARKFQKRNTVIRQSFKLGIW